jgi:hypothetical protein
MSRGAGAQGQAIKDAAGWGLSSSIAGDAKRLAWAEISPMRVSQHRHSFPALAP